MANKQYIGARYVPKFYEGSNGNNWDSGVYYEPLTVVQCLNDSYTSKIPVPSTVGSPNMNPKYWAHTGAYNAQVEQYRDEVLNFVNTNNDNQFAYMENITTNNIYVNSNTGVDDAEHGTQALPFKTLDYALQKANKHSDVRIVILNSDTYACNMVVFSGGGLHITAPANTVIEFEKDAAFYGAHLNITSSSGYITIRVNSRRKLFYLDGGTIATHNVIYDCVFRLNGAMGGAADCTFRNIYVHGCCMQFNGDNNTIIDKADTDLASIYSENGYILGEGAININLTSVNNGDFIYARGGIIDFANDFVNNGTGVFSGGVNMNHCVAILHASVVESIDDFITTEQSYGPMCVVTYHSGTKTTGDEITVSGAGYNNLLTETVPSGAYLLTITVETRSEPSEAFDGLIRVEGVTPIGTVYNSHHFSSEFNCACTFSLMCYATAEQQITIDISHANGAVMRATLAATRM